MLSKLNEAKPDKFPFRVHQIREAGYIQAGFSLSKDVADVKTCAQSKYFASHFEHLINMCELGEIEQLIKK